MVARKIAAMGAEDGWIRVAENAFRVRLDLVVADREGRCLRYSEGKAGTPCTGTGAEGWAGEPLDIEETGASWSG